MRMITSALVGAVILSACQPAAVTLTVEDTAAIRDIGTSYAQANIAGDADAVAALYSEDAVEMPPNLPAREGRAAIRESYAEFFGLDVEVSEFTLNSVELDGANGVAFERGTWTWTGIPPGMTESMSDTGKYIGIARKQADGSWLWTSVIWNSDVPLPQP